MRSPGFPFTTRKFSWMYCLTACAGPCTEAETRSSAVSTAEDTSSPTRTWSAAVPLKRSAYSAATEAQKDGDGHREEEREAPKWTSWHCGPQWWHLRGGGAEYARIEISTVNLDFITLCCWPCIKTHMHFDIFCQMVKWYCTSTSYITAQMQLC